jgi:hypothetical protein
LTAKLFTPAAPDTTAFTADSVTERTNAKGQYVASFGEASAISGDHTLILFSGTRPVAIGHRTFAGTDGETATETATLAELDSSSLAAVNAQVVDALSVDTYAELSAPPAATSSLKDKITWLFMYARNKVTQTALARTLYRDDTTTVAGTSATSDNGTTFTKGEDT